MKQKISLVESFRNLLNLLSEEEYRGEHVAPNKEDAPLYDLTANGIYPEDVYSVNGERYYGSGDPYDSQVFSLVRACRNHPSKPVKIYRAVPVESTPSKELAKLEKEMYNYMKSNKMPPDSKFTKGSDWYDWAYDERERLSKLPEPEQQKLTINHGDWVSVDRQYAKDHGDANLNGNYKIISKTVPARQVFTDGNSIREWGWDPS